MQKKLLVDLLVIEILCISTWAYTQREEGDSNVSAPELVWKYYDAESVSSVIDAVRTEDRGLLIAVIIMISFALTLLGSLFLWALGRSFEKVVFG